MLFNIYIDDIDQAVRDVLLKKFADDTKMAMVVESKEDAERMQKNLDRLSEWAREWKMEFNTGKCKVMHVGLNNGEYKYEMNGETLASVTEEKDLGVLISDTLTFSSHIGKIPAKVNSVLGIIRRTFSYFSKESFLILY